MSVLRYLVVTSALLQLIGTALIVWGLKIVTNTDVVTFYPEYGRPLPSAGIVREHAWSVTWGAQVLLAGLAVQVVVSSYPRPRR
jgi:hypothetical protein